MLRLRAGLASRNLEVDLELAEHERLAILGPNGAGKSSVLAVLAGLLRPDAGRAELDGRVLFDLSRTRPGQRVRWLPPHARGVVLMSQDPLLFPHLSVGANVAFGPRSAGVGKSTARAAARHWLDQVGAADLVDRKPGQLSGGQAQRVAIARALACDPKLLLLDEPMAALDVGAAPELRELLRRVLVERSCLLVSHDLLDALILADRVVVLEAGRIVESGPTADVLRHPKTPFSARLAGLNLVLGRAHARGVQQQDGQVVEGLARVPLTVGQPAVAVFSPSAVSVYAVPPHGSPRNTIEVVVTELEPREDQMRVRAATRSGQVLAADVTVPVVSELGLYPGARVYYSLKASAVTLYPA